MSAYTQYLIDQKAFNDQIKSEIDSMNAKIAQLQASTGAVTPDDQVLIDALESQGKTLAGVTPPTVPAA